MTTLREAAEMALDALEAHADIGIKSDKAVFALREALAQPEQEPVAWKTMPDAEDFWIFINGSDNPNGILDGKWHPLYATPPQRKPLTLEIHQPNEAGSTLVTARWFVDTPHGWIGAWDREAIEYVVGDKE